MAFVVFSNPIYDSMLVLSYFSVKQTDCRANVQVLERIIPTPPLLYEWLWYGQVLGVTHGATWSCSGGC